MLFEKFCNLSPTPAEELLFKLGYYRLDNNPSNYYGNWLDYFSPIKYVAIHSINTKLFLKHLEVAVNNIDYNDMIIFCPLSENASISADYKDIDYIYAILKRMDELGFKHLPLIEKQRKDNYKKEKRG